MLGLRRPHRRPHRRPRRHRRRRLRLPAPVGPEPLPPGSADPARAAPAHDGAADAIDDSTDIVEAVEQRNTVAALLEGPSPSLRTAVRSRT